MGLFNPKLVCAVMRKWGGVGGGGGCDVNPLKVSGGLKEGRIRLVGECNQCDYITEHDERGREGRRE